MHRIKTIITSPFRKFFERFGPTPDELEELQEIEKIVHHVLNQFKHTA